MILKIKELREEMQLTQTELAKRIGNSQRNVSNWETGASEPDIQTIVRLADVFGVSIDELFGRNAVPREVEKTEGMDRILIHVIRKLSDAQKTALLSLLQSFSVI